MLRYRDHCVPKQEARVVESISVNGAVRGSVFAGRIVTYQLCVGYLCMLHSEGLPHIGQGWCRFQEENTGSLIIFRVFARVRFCGGEYYHSLLCCQ